jgi:lipopolysaccharide biosynthesis regulator YciM
MRIRTFLSILVLLGVSYALAELAVKNQQVLQQDVKLWGGTSLPVGLMLLVFLLVGFLITVVFGISREAGRMLERWRNRRTLKKTEEIEEEYSRGLVAVLEGRDEVAMRHFRAVLERDSRHFNTLLKLGEVLRAQGRHADAIEYHRKAQNLKDDDTRPLYALVDDYEAKGDMARARNVLGKIIGVNKSSVSAWRKLRSLHVKEENWDDAWAAHQKVERYSSSQDPIDHRVGRGIRCEIAGGRLRAGKPKEAAAMLRRLLKEDPRFIPAHVRLGVAMIDEGQETEAIEAWYRGFESTGSPILLTTLEEHHLQREQPLAAIEALKHCVSMTDKDTLPRFYLGKLYFRLEMLDDAMSVLSSLEGRATYAPTLHYLLGRIHDRRRNFCDASREYRKVIREMELVQVEYRCAACGVETMEWSDRCAECGEWNCVEVNFREEISLEELGLAPAPVYTSRT